MHKEELFAQIQESVILCDEEKAAPASLATNLLT